MTLTGPGIVQQLRVVGRLVLAGGSFDVVGGQRRNGLVAIAAADSRLLPAWNPGPERASVGAIAASGSRVLIVASLDGYVEIASALGRQPLSLARLGSRLRFPLSASSRAVVAVELRTRPEPCPDDEYGPRCSGRLVRRVLVRFERASTRICSLRLTGVSPGAFFIRFAVLDRGPRRQPPLDRRIELVA